MQNTFLFIFCLGSIQTREAGRAINVAILFMSKVIPYTRIHTHQY